MKKVICRTVLTAILLAAALGSTAMAKSEFDRKLDSLFVIASSGEIRYQSLRDPAMDSIAAYGVNAVPFLIDKFTTKSAGDRWTIIWIFQRIGSPAVPLLIEALKRPDELVVQRVAWALGDIKDSSAVDGLIGVRLHSCWQVRDEAISALGRIGHPRAAQAVREALLDTIGQVRKSAVVSCGQLKVGDATAELVHSLGDDFYGARLAAVNALLQLDTTSVVAVLGDSLESANPLVGHLACKLLGRIGSQQALSLLMEQAESIDLERRAHAACALAKADPDDRCAFRSTYFESEPDRLARLKVESVLRPVKHEQ
jgi:HEAT repeat protein